MPYYLQRRKREIYVFLKLGVVLFRSCSHRLCILLGYGGAVALTRQKVRDSPFRAVGADCPEPGWRSLHTLFPLLDAIVDFLSIFAMAVPLSCTSEDSTGGAQAL
jgi:hypothetical protein